MQKDIIEIVKRLFKFLEQFMELDQGLRDQLSAKMEPVYYPLDKTLFIAGEVITSLFFITEGYMTCSGFPGEQVLDIYGHDQLVIPPSFNDHSVAAHDLKVIGGTYVLTMSYEDMQLVYESNPSAERLVKLVLSHYKKLDTWRLLMIGKRALDSVFEFYTRFPELLVKGGGLLKDSIIASYLLIEERTLGRNRAENIRSERLKYPKK